MNLCMITFRSVTPAQRAEMLLRRTGVYCKLGRTPRHMEEQGCGYSLKIKCLDLPEALQLFSQGSIQFRKIYRLDRDGKMEEWTP